MKLLLIPALVAAMSAPAAAQSSAQSRYNAVLKACQAEAARLCATGSDEASGHNQAICLRPYRSNLSLACRRAVTAASR